MMADSTLLWYFSRLACRSYFNEVTVVQFPVTLFRSDISVTEIKTGCTDVSDRTVGSLQEFPSRGGKPKRINFHKIILFSVR